MSSADHLIRVARVLAKYPGTGSRMSGAERPGWRKQPDGTTKWSDPSPMPDPRPAPSREVGVRYDARVRWGRFVGFEADDRGLLARVEFSDGVDAHDPQDVVSIDRVVGLNGAPVARAAGLDEPPTPVAVMLERIRDLEVGLIDACEAIESWVQSETQHGDHRDDLDWKRAARLRDLADRKVT